MNLHDMGSVFIHCEKNVFALDHGFKHETRYYCASHAFVFDLNIGQVKTSKVGSWTLREFLKKL